MAETGLRLVGPLRSGPVTSLAAVNDALADVGTRVWPLDLGTTPAKVRFLLERPRLTAAEVRQVRDHFLLSRTRLVDIVGAARRAPHVPDGGALETIVVPGDHAYPHLYVVDPDEDYGRFDRFHVNTSDGGTGVDEVMHVLSGGGVRLIQRLPDDQDATLHLDCPDPARGWLLTYDGAVPHIGSLSRARPGTKVLMQIIGPPRWSLRYTDGAV